MCYLAQPHMNKTILITEFWRPETVTLLSLLLILC